MVKFLVGIYEGNFLTGGWCGQPPGGFNLPLTLDWFEFPLSLLPTLGCDDMFFFGPISLIFLFLSWFVFFLNIQILGV